MQSCTQILRTSTRPNSIIVRKTFRLYTLYCERFPLSWSASISVFVGFVLAGLKVYIILRTFPPSYSASISVFVGFVLAGLKVYIILRTFPPSYSASISVFVGFVLAGLKCLCVTTVKFVYTCMRV